MNETDIRILDLIQKTIEQYRNKEILFSIFVVQLESDIHHIEDNETKSLFLQNWWDLEQVLAFSLDQQKSFLEDKEKKNCQ